MVVKRRAVKRTVEEIVCKKELNSKSALVTVQHPERLTNGADTTSEKVLKASNSRKHAKTNGSARDAVAEAINLYSLIHFYPEQPEWTIHPSNFQSLDPLTLLVDGHKGKIVLTPAARERGPPYYAANSVKPFRLKCFVLMKADGVIANPFVGILPCDEVPPGEIVPIRLPFFSPYASGYGEIWLVNKTSGNDMRLVHKRLLTSVVIPSFYSSLEQTRKWLSRQDLGVEEVCLFQCDGEISAFTDPGVLQEYANGVKQSPGTSFVFRASDVSHFHTNLHNYVNEQTYSRFLSPSEVDETRILIEKTQDLLRSQGRAPLSTDTVSKLMRAFKAIQPALSSGLDVSKNLERFRKCGLWSGGDCDLEALLLRSDVFKDMPTSDFEALLERILEKCKNPRTGPCSEAELDELGIPMTDEEKERSKSKLDQMPETRQRAFIFTGPEEEETKKKKKRKQEEKKEVKKCVTSRKTRADKIEALLESSIFPSDDDVVKCPLHGYSKSQWIQGGLGGRGWKTCSKCHCHFCPLCSKVASVHERNCVLDFPEPRETQKRPKPPLHLPAPKKKDTCNWIRCDQCNKWRVLPPGQEWNKSRFVCADMTTKTKRVQCSDPCDCASQGEDCTCK